MGDARGGLRGGRRKGDGDAGHGGDDRGRDIGRGGRRSIGDATSARRGGGFEVRGAALPRRRARDGIYGFRRRVVARARVLYRRRAVEDVHDALRGGERS